MWLCTYFSACNYFTLKVPFLFLTWLWMKLFSLALMGHSGQTMCQFNLSSAGLLEFILPVKSENLDEMAKSSSLFSIWSGGWIETASRRNLVDFRLETWCFWKGGVHSRCICSSSYLNQNLLCHSLKVKTIIFPGVPCPSVPRGLSCYHVFSLPGEAGDTPTKLLFLTGEVKTEALLCCAVSELYHCKTVWKLPQRTSDAKTYILSAESHSAVCRLQFNFIILSIFDPAKVLVV